MTTINSDERENQPTVILGKKRESQLEPQALLEELNKLRADIGRQATGSLVETLFAMRRERDLSLRGLLS